MHGKIKVDKNSVVDVVERTVFGVLAEHIGRVIYNGIYEPTHETADGDGFRRDVIELVKELGATAVRYPGGNFVSGYHWKDGIGKKEERPRRLNLAWQELEPNQVGIDEFARWASLTDCEIVMTVNMGSGTPQEAAEEVEYCNIEGGTTLSDLRIANGAKQPYRIRYWCVGNEMDGDYQIGALPAKEYGRKAYEAAKQMKLTDPDCKFIVCGNSSPWAAEKFGSWNKTVLSETYKFADYLSLHAYYDYGEDRDIADFLASPVNFETYILNGIGICDSVKEETGKRIDLSIDEWNVWHRFAGDESHETRFRLGDPLLENEYDMADALVVGGMLCVLINNCNRVKIACIAQLVNVIAPILTEVGGKAIRQTTFFPFSMFTACRGLKCLKQEKETDVYISKRYGETPYLYSSICFDEGKGEYVCCLVNVGEEAYSLELDFTESVHMTEHSSMTAPLHQKNTFENPNAVVPKKRKVTGKAAKRQLVTLEPFSVNLIRFES